MTRTLFQESFEDWGQKIAATRPAMISPSVDRLHPKVIKEQDLKKNITEDL